MRRDTAEPLHVIHPISLPNRVKLRDSTNAKLLPAKFDWYRASGRLSWILLGEIDPDIEDLVIHS